MESSIFYAVSYSGIDYGALTYLECLLLVDMRFNHSL